MHRHNNSSCYSSAQRPTGKTGVRCDEQPTCEIQRRRVKQQRFFYTSQLHNEGGETNTSCAVVVATSILLSIVFYPQVRSFPTRPREPGGGYCHTVNRRARRHSQETAFLVMYFHTPLLHPLISGRTNHCVRQSDRLRFARLKELVARYNGQVSGATTKCHDMLLHSHDASVQVETFNRHVFDQIVKRLHTSSFFRRSL